MMDLAGHYGCEESCMTLWMWQILHDNMELTDLAGQYRYDRSCITDITGLARYYGYDGSCRILRI